MNSKKNRGNVLKQFEINEPYVQLAQQAKNVLQEFIINSFLL
jgi:hypothetical protein